MKVQMKHSAFRWIFLLHVCVSIETHITRSHNCIHRSTLCMRCELDTTRKVYNRRFTTITDEWNNADKIIRLQYVVLKYAGVRYVEIVQIVDICLTDETRYDCQSSQFQWNMLTQELHMILSVDNTFITLLVSSNSFPNKYFLLDKLQTMCFLNRQQSSI